MKAKIALFLSALSVVSMPLAAGSKPSEPPKAKEQSNEQVAMQGQGRENCMQNREDRMNNREQNIDNRQEQHQQR